MLHENLVQAKKHSSLIPFLVFTGTGGTKAVIYDTHLASFNPDVSLDRNNNLEYWNKLDPNDQYKFYAVDVDFNKPKKEGSGF
ncbi:cytochrome c oxidase subunit NDUFA4-like [Erinaceus europaeus]|uniref:Cytochrome c oxidase subunit NDUFA4 n=1 Tax=Erinaceus europaeus TaxID=9365 RepID=A0ABM3W0N8_ERIEU|nr:cytochrome c oxidase subunit NDUFA4-like [Erinaceus europaeus]